MTTPLQRVDAYIDQHFDRFVGMLGDLCAIPSVAAQGQGIDPCATRVAELLSAVGLDAQLIATAGNPVVYAEAKGTRDTTLLCYNHYDVQPAEPFDLWHSDPFTMTRKDNLLIARGVADDKGELVSRIAAIAAVKHVLGDLPVGIKFLIEGEEEIASPNLAPFIHANVDRLKADACVWEFGTHNADGVPISYLGLRGICYLELSVETAKIDTHSGIAGSILPNAAWRLVWALNTLKDQDERIQLPNFYESVIAPTARDMELLAALPDSDEEMQELFGNSMFLKNASGVELRRREIFEPTCTICGITTGYQGAGQKTVLPARASAKVDFRLVPDQKPEDVVKQLRAHFDAHGFHDINITVVGAGRPARTAPDHPLVQSLVASAKDVYGREPLIWPMSGGSGPNYLFSHNIGVPIVTLGVGYSGSRIHAPNENIRINDFRNGMRHMAALLMRLGA
ncbi:MAG: M20/M25/M40 family metallo-hydrolase [Chloroflexi bacterium]|nr:MAG: M20/M25/M40 family metallo-hydrolase [Chloroflexota bacterium]RLT33911.1 MAG: M20/M25/M40 family metallo-hydrolase [Chloroflexota bacterium]